MTGIVLGFIPDSLSVSLDRLLPSRKTPAELIASVKFKQIRSSIEDVGLIEPLSVTTANPTTGQHLLLDPVQDPGLKRCQSRLLERSSFWEHGIAPNELGQHMAHAKVHSISSGPDLCLSKGFVGS